MAYLAPQWWYLVSDVNLLSAKSDSEVACLKPAFIDLAVACLMLEQQS